MNKVLKMEHSKYSIEYDPKTMVIKKILRGDEDVTKELNFNIVRDLFFCAIELEELKHTQWKDSYKALINEYAETIKKLTTPPTQEQVCKALSEYYNLPVKFYLQHNCFVIVRGYEHIIIVEQEVKNKNVRFNNKKAMPALPPHLITLIGRFYEGVMENE